MITHVCNPKNGVSEMIFADPATQLDMELHEVVCSIGHIHNGHLPACPWCTEGTETLNA